MPVRLPVNAVVEKKNLESDVAAEHVNRVVAADGKRVTISGSDPYFQFRARNLDSGGHRGSASVDGVESVSVHVIREAARAADAGDNDEVFALDAEFRENSLNGRKDCVVAAARAPADFLVRLEIFLCKRRESRCGHRSFS